MAPRNGELTGLGAEDLTGNQVVETFGDTSVRFVAPYHKDAAEYVEPDDDDFDPDHKRCVDCVHFIENGGCHFVRGEIRGDAYCSEFYADYGAFAHDRGDDVVVNAELHGDQMDFDERDIDDFLGDIEERLQQRHQERQADASDSDGYADEDDGGWWIF